MAKKKQRKPTARELTVMRQIGNGADIWAYSAAMTCRRIEKELPGLIKIVKAKASPPGHMQQPYFGAKLTVAGKAAAIASIKSVL